MDAAAQTGAEFLLPNDVPESAVSMTHGIATSPLDALLVHVDAIAMSTSPLNNSASRSTGSGGIKLDGVDGFSPSMSAASISAGPAPAAPVVSGSNMAVKVKRPVGRPRKDGLPPMSRKQKEKFIGALDGGIFEPGDWADLLQSNPQEFLQTLLTSLHTPDPPSTSGTPTVKDAFKSHLGSLSQAPSQNQHMPALYSIMKTFWLPASPPYFALTASAMSARTLSEHRFLYWDPLPLVFNGLLCQFCSSALHNRGRITSGPVKIYDIERPFFVIGCEYVCTNHQCGRAFASIDASILRALPSKLRHEFPARLVVDEVGIGQDVWNWTGLGVSLALWNLVKGALKAGVRKNALLQTIKAVQDGVYEERGDEEEPAMRPMTPLVLSQPQPMWQPPPSSSSPSLTSPSIASPSIQPPPQPPPPPLHPAQASFPSFPLFRYAAPYAYNAAGPAGPTPAAGPIINNLTVPSKRPYPFADDEDLSEHLQLASPLSASMSAPPAPLPPSAPPTTAPVGSPAPVSGPGMPVPAGGTLMTKRRNPRHCVKCGSADCKGKGGRAFCSNPCQDCGRMDCKGRNSRRPEKRCDDGWTGPNAAQHTQNNNPAGGGSGNGEGQGTGGVPGPGAGSSVMDHAAMGSVR